MKNAALRRCTGLLLGAAGLLAATIGMVGPAHADIKLPNGTVVPQGGALQDYLNGVGNYNVDSNNQPIQEMINGVRDAAISPEKFSPLCEFAGQYIAKGGGASFAIGWYNVDDSRAATNPPLYKRSTGDLNVAAADSDIQILFPFATALPPANMRALTSQSIRNNPAYKGGLIGFVLVPNPSNTGNQVQYKYTESRFNAKCTKCTAAGETPGPWHTRLIYKSNKLANTFYLGFEDLDFTDASGSAGVAGNDLDYEDFLFRFTGIACEGAGKSCAVSGAKGACAIGVTECNGAGTLTCKGITAPNTLAEKCDGIDNDCNGQVDDGATCPMGKTCDRGRCTTQCSGEFPCPGGLSCDDGKCIDQACVGVSCDVTQVCRLGKCVSPCDNIVCPNPYICSGGTCIDPCVDTDPTTGVQTPKSCGQGKTCIGGACVTTCDCLPCGAGLGCQGSTGKCVDIGCENKTCGAGDTCVAGQCQASCLNAKCPLNQKCELGKCIDAISTTPIDPNNPDPNNPDDGSGGGGAIDTGCACRLAPGQTGSSALGFGAGMLLLGWAALRTRRRRMN